jgi:hypothetical protein
MVATCTAVIAMYTLAAAAYELIVALPQ